VADLIAGAREAAAAYEEASRDPDSLFEIWRRAYGRCLERGEALGLNHLTAAHGSSLMERVLLDGLGVATGLSYHQLLMANEPGLDLGQVLPELAGVDPPAAISPAPLPKIHVRHTVGLADPLEAADLTPEERLDDGLPQTLEEYVARQGVTYFKLKVSGDRTWDMDRLHRIAQVLEPIAGDYSVTLDGNEQYEDLGDFLVLLEAMAGDPHLRQLHDRILYLEQPLERGSAMDRAMGEDIRRVSAHAPMLIDESDGELTSFREATRLGYAGVSTKNCKGLIKALANQALARQLTAAGEGAHFLSGEDLMNLPVLPLHQDLAHLACLGITHAERNGHHYVRGLDHLSPAERAQCLERHGPLYESRDGSAFLAVRQGQLDLTSLQLPGLGGGVAVDEASMIPLEDWEFDSLS
jgi:L-alanine-DL-glutamate epimerase-like enolase superfamily enzyme